MSSVNRRIVLAARPDGEPTPDNFRLEEAPIPEPGDRQLLLRTLYLSLDPYMRGRMSAAKSYARSVEVGEVMEGGTVGEVVASNHRDFKPGEIVRAYSGWQSHAVADAGEVTRLDPAVAPVSTALGVLGMPGMTAYVGLLNIGKPRAGETVAVAAATGPVGSAVGQIARLKGARAVGIAGGPDKCRALVEEFGFDAAVDHRAPDFAERLQAACPDGIDVYFENVGGPVLAAVLPLLNDFARIPVCGLIAHYNDKAGANAAPDRLPGFLRQTLTQRLTWRGFIVWDFKDQAEQFERDMAGWLKEGRVRYREDVVDGLERAPEAFIGLLQGRNFGKLVVKVADRTP